MVTHARSGHIMFEMPQGHFQCTHQVDVLVFLLLPVYYSIWLMLNSNKCECGGRKIGLIRSLSEILSPKWYHCVYLLSTLVCALFSLLALVSTKLAYLRMLKSVKCYRGGRKMDLISSISEIQSQTWYHCIQCPKRHHMSIFSHC